MRIAAELARLALHFHRVDLQATQAKLVVEDFLNDLAPYSVADIVDACGVYRRNGANKFFPTPGMLLDVLKTIAPTNAGGLPTFKPSQRQLEGPRATRSVADVLREHGMNEKAQAWQDRHSSN
jgi:hypothetical protein